MPIKRYNGSSQVVQEAKRWNGSAWVRQVVKRWNGSAWVDIDSVTPVYTWEKWSVEATLVVDSYSDETGGAQFMDQIPSTSTWQLGTGFSFNTTTGAYTVTGSAFATINGGGYEGSMDEYVVTVDGGDPNWYNVTKYTHTATAATSHYEYSKGATQYANVTSEDPDAYPANGHQDGYWYVAVV